MSGNREGKSVIGGKQKDVSVGGGIVRREEGKEGEFGFQFVDLTLQLFLCLVGFFVALFAGACVCCQVMILA